MTSSEVHMDVNIPDVAKNNIVLVVTPTGLQEFRVRMLAVKILLKIVNRIAPFTVEWRDPV